MIPSVQRAFAPRSTAGAGGYALYAGRLSAEKGVADAIAACKRAGVPLVLAGDGPDAEALKAGANDGVRFLGRVGPGELAALRTGAALALVPSRYAEILPLAALEAMAAALPVVASHAGGLAEVVPEPGLHPPGDVQAMANRIRVLWADEDAGAASLEAVRQRCSPAAVASALRRVYGA